MVVWSTSPGKQPRLAEVQGERERREERYWEETHCNSMAWNLTTKLSGYILRFVVVAVLELAMSSKFEEAGTRVNGTSRSMLLVYPLDPITWVCSSLLPVIGVIISVPEDFSGSFQSYSVRVKVVKRVES